LETAIKAVFEGSEKNSGVKKAREMFVEQHAFKIDGKSSERIIRFVRRLYRKGFKKDPG